MNRLVVIILESLELDCLSLGRASNRNLSIQDFFECISNIASSDFLHIVTNLGEAFHESISLSEHVVILRNLHNLQSQREFSVAGQIVRILLLTWVRADWEQA